MATMDANTRWPDALAQRLAARDVAVLNAGISGARLLKDRMGENALARFDRDVLSQPGIAAVIVLLGINDIGWHGTPLGPRDGVASADDLIAGYRQLIARAHARGVRIVGATLTPFEGALADSPMRDYFNADKERVRQAVNAWIRESGEFRRRRRFRRDAARSRKAGALPGRPDAGDHLHRRRRLQRDGAGHRPRHTAGRRHARLPPPARTLIMEYHHLGNSGLRVPALSFGTGTFGGKGELFGSWGDADVAQASRMIDVCLDAGLNLFDSADVYSGGTAEDASSARPSRAVATRC